MTQATTKDDTHIAVPCTVERTGEEYPAEVLNVFRLFGPADYKAWQVFQTWEDAPRVEIPADKVLVVGQTEGARCGTVEEYRSQAAAAPADQPVCFRKERLNPVDDEYSEMDYDAHLVGFNGEWYLIDGNHRVAGARLEGRATYGRLFDLDARAAAAAASEPVVLEDDEARFWHMVEGDHENDNVLVNEDDSDEDVFDAHDYLHSLHGICDHRH